MAGVLALALGGLTVVLVTARPDSTSGAIFAAGEVYQCNPGNPPAPPAAWPGSGGGYEVTCSITIVNTVTARGATSSTVTAIACAGAAKPIVKQPTRTAKQITAANRLQVLKC